MTINLPHWPRGLSQRMAERLMDIQIPAPYTPDEVVGRLSGFKRQVIRTAMIRVGRFQYRTQPKSSESRRDLWEGTLPTGSYPEQHAETAINGDTEIRRRRSEVRKSPHADIMAEGRQPDGKLKVEDEGIQTRVSK